MDALIIMLDIFLAMGGMVGGKSFVTDPSGAKLGMNTAQLKRVPLIDDYFLPGIFLLFVYTFGGLLAALATFTGEPWADGLNIIIGAILIVWITIQLILIPDRHIIQLICFVIALGLVILPLM